MRLAARILIALTLAAAPLTAQSLRTISGNRQMSGHPDELNVKVTFAAGRLTVGRDDTGMLYRAKVVYDEDRFEPVLDYSSDDRTLTVGVNGLKGKHDHNSEGSKQEVRLQVSPKVPSSFVIEFGAAEADVDLGGLNLVRAEVNTGATDATVRFSTPTTGRCQELTFHVGAAKFSGEEMGNSRCRSLNLLGGVGDITLDLTGDWGDVTRPAVDISVGMGNLTLRLPRNIGVAVEIAKIFTTFDQSGFVKRDGGYYSPNYDAATTKLKLDIKSALGTVNVEWR